MSLALVANDLVLRFGDTTALDGFSLSAAAGEVSALLGPNGAGKTSFIRCATAISHPCAGNLSIFGHAPGSVAARSLIGVMPQTTGAWAASTPLQLLTYLAKLYANPQPVTELIELLGIKQFERIHYRRLSGGQQQAVNLAGALIGRPSLLFLDEPTAGLDPRARKDTWKLISALRQAGVAVLLTTHDMVEAQQLSDKVHIVHRGRVRAVGSVPDIVSEYGSVEKAFFACTEGGTR